MPPGIVRLWAGLRRCANRRWPGAAMRCVRTGARRRAGRRCEGQGWGRGGRQSTVLASDKQEKRIRSLANRLELPLFICRPAGFWLDAIDQVRYRFIPGTGPAAFLHGGAGRRVRHSHLDAGTDFGGRHGCSGSVVSEAVSAFVSSTKRNCRYIVRGEAISFDGNMGPIFLQGYISIHGPDFRPRSGRSNLTDRLMQKIWRNHGEHFALG